MDISASVWEEYKKRQRKIREKAANFMQEWIDANGVSDRTAMLKFAANLVDKYGAAAGSVACDMYDSIAAAQGVKLPAAVIADISNFGEIAKAINGSLIHSPEGKEVASVVERMTKRVASDTMVKNAKRDGAEFAWIPSGRTCAYCLMIASRGWGKVKKKTLEGNHADHIHANCNCEFSVRFDGKSSVKGYDYKSLKEEWDSFSGTEKERLKQWEEKLNNERPKVIDVTKEYEKNKKPGIGKIIFENGTTKEELRDRDTATWIYNNFGGNIICLPEESELGKNPDSLWEGIYWEFKQPTTRNAIDDRLKKGKRQIRAVQERENCVGERCGFVIDLVDSKIPIYEAIEQIEKSTMERLKNADVIIKNGNKLIKVIRIE